jgi:hypothetical protein
MEFETSSFGHCSFGVHLVETHNVLTPAGDWVFTGRVWRIGVSCSPTVELSEVLGLCMLQWPILELLCSLEHCLLFCPALPVRRVSRPNTMRSVRQEAPTAEMLRRA